mmetsp:Transcript_2333/g.3265  ORF Transcript_2333/g.3265 Transcript_2333/m.3265 type:complete len:361 (-) Transcript_2333:180-1262(-)
MKFKKTKQVPLLLTFSLALFSLLLFFYFAVGVNLRKNQPLPTAKWLNSADEHGRNLAHEVYNNSGLEYFVPQIEGDTLTVLLEGKVNNITCDELSDYRPAIDNLYPAHHIHIPKCSGSSLTDAIKKSLPRNKKKCVICKQKNKPFPEWHRATPPNDKLGNEFKQCDFLSTHTPFEYPESFSGRKFNVQVAILREPKALFVSNYDYVKSFKTIPGSAYLKATPISKVIKKCLGDPSHLRETWWVDPKTVSGEFSYGNRQTWFICGYSCSIKRMSVHEALMKAVENLITRIHLVGTTENSAQLYHRLHAVYKWISPNQIHKNKSPVKQKTTLTAQDSDNINKLMHADVILHKVATFIERCSD